MSTASTPSNSSSSSSAAGCISGTVISRDTNNCTLLKFILNDGKINVPKFKLNNGAEIPMLGVGTWLGFNDRWEFNYNHIDNMTETLPYAIDIGFRYIDTAHYNRVEPEVGEIVNKAIKDGVVKREELFIATKVWNNFHREADVEVAVRASLRRTRLEYFDLVTMHWPMSVSQEGVDEKIDYLETWRGLEAVMNKGLAKGIGVANFNIDQMKRLLTNCMTPPAVLQIEVNLTLAQNELVDYCKAKNIVVVAFSPFGCMLPSRAFPGSPEPRSNNPALTKITEKYKKTSTQLVLKYLIQRGIVPIPKMILKPFALENIHIFDITIEPEDMQAMAAFDLGFRAKPPVFWQDFENYPFDRTPSPAIMEIPKLF